jgi:Na+/melibiose symporter-like transporter
LLFTLSGAFAGVAYVDILGKSFTPDIRRSLLLNKQVISSIGLLISALIVRALLGLLSYPSSYFTLYIAAAGALLVASAGFYVLKEPVSHVRKAPVSFLDTIKSIPSRIKKDANLRYYILVANFVGVGIVLLPFYMAFAKRQYSLPPDLVGNLLLVQIGGTVLSSIGWRFFVNRNGFKGILYVLSVLGMILPISAFFVGTYLPVWVYLVVFFLSGMAISAQRITAEAVLVEISTDEDRALYSGIIGTLNLTVAILPIAAGAIVSVIGFMPLFLAAAVFPGCAILFIRKMDCPIDRERSGR